MVSVSRPALRLAVWLLTAAGCSGGKTNRGAADSTRAAGVSLDTAGCAFVAVHMHENPDSLVHEFVRRDAAGQFRGATEWFNAAVDCPGREPGPDVAAVARLVGLNVVARSADSVVAEVRWDRVGYASATSFESDPGGETDTLTAVRTPFGWRIRSPALNPHMPPPSAPPVEDRPTRPAA